MNSALLGFQNGRKRFRDWSLLKKTIMAGAGACFVVSSFLFVTPPGSFIRDKLAETVITTQHREWAWIFVGGRKRDEMVQDLLDRTDAMGEGHIDLSKIKHVKRPIDSLIKVEDISGKYWKGKKVYVYDPTTIRVVVPNKQGEGERITSMVQRTGAVMGVNGGGFVDPDGLGNGFAPIGFIMSGGSLIYNDQDGGIPQNVVGFTDQGTLVVGKYSIDELEKLHVNEAVSFYPRVIADGKPLITSGDGGWGRGPRTAVGQKADGTVIFIVIDGRQAHSIGATLREVQDLLLEEGCVNAGFLDGGASSELVANNQLLTSPSSRYGERRLPSGFLVLDNPRSYKADHIWDGLTTIDPGGAYDNPGYLQEQAELKAKGQLPTATPAPARQTQTQSAQPTKKPSTPAPSEARSAATPTPTAGNTERSGGTTTTTSPDATVKPSPSATASRGAGASAAPAGQPTPAGTAAGTLTAAPPKASPSASASASASATPAATPGSVK